MSEEIEDKLGIREALQKNPKMLKHYAKLLRESEPDIALSLHTNIQTYAGHTAKGQRLRQVFEERFPPQGENDE